jgi:hypothetical protein
LYPGESDPAVHEKGGNAGDPEPVGAHILRLDAGQAVVAVHEPVNLIAVEPRSGRDAREDRTVAEVFALHEVSAKKPLDNGILDAPLVGEPDQPVGFQGVWRPLGTREIESDAIALCSSRGPFSERRAMNREGGEASTMPSLGFSAYCTTAGKPVLAARALHFKEILIKR